MENGECPPFWTVAVPVYNGDRHLAEALRSVRDPGTVSGPVELIVRDDHSDDQSVAIASGWAEVIRNPERLGLVGNWNACVDACRTPYLTLFHQDDRMRPGHLESHRRAFQNRPDLGMVCGASVLIDDDGNERIDESAPNWPTARIYEPGEFLDELAVANPVRCSAVSLNIDAIRGIGGFDRRYRYAVDWDAWIRIARSWPVAWLAEPTVEIRWHAGSETHRFQTGTVDLDEQERLLTGLHASDPARFGPEVRRRSRQRLAWAFLNRAYLAARAGDRRLEGLALKRAIGLDLATIGRIVREPRLAVRLLLGPGRS